MRRPIPGRIGPCEFAPLGKLIAVCCPSDFDPLMRRAGSSCRITPGRNGLHGAS